MEQKIRLRAEDAEDLAVIAAFLQDACLPLKEMVFRPEEGQFMAAFTRYRREVLDDPTSCEGLEEISSVLIFECIKEVKHRNLVAEDLDRELVLLTIATEPGERQLFHIDLVFEGDCEVQLRSDCIDCRMEDFGESRPARRSPCDHLVELEAAMAAATRSH